MSADLLAAFLVGIAGSMHCVGMCGGIVGAFSAHISAQRRKALLHLGYHTGRISSYALAGAVMGLSGSYINRAAADGLGQSISLLSAISGLFLILMGLYVSGWWRLLVKLESVGAKVWKWIQPIGKRLLPVNSPLQSIAYGAIWGWLPCGLVYSTLTWSLASGSALSGAGIMVAFGLGTLPALGMIALGGHQARTLLTLPVVRHIMGLLLIAYGVYQISHSIRI